MDSIRIKNLILLVIVADLSLFLLERDRLFGKLQLQQHHRIQSCYRNKQIKLWFGYCSFCALTHFISLPPISSYGTPFFKKNSEKNRLIKMVNLKQSRNQLQIKSYFNEKYNNIITVVGMNPFHQ